MLWWQGAQNIALSNYELKSALKCTVWSQCTPVPDRQTNTMATARLFSLTKASRAKKIHDFILSETVKSFSTHPVQFKILSTDDVLWVRKWPLKWRDPTRPRLSVTFDLLTSKPNQSIFVAKITKFQRCKYGEILPASLWNIVFTKTYACTYRQTNPDT